MSEPESLATHEALSRHLTRRVTDQLIMLSDKVFAIAITLAAIEIHVPFAPTFSAAIAEMNVALLAYVMSFVVIAVFWTGNRDLFARLQRIARPLTALVLGTLCLTALIPHRFASPFRAKGRSVAHSSSTRCSWCSAARSTSCSSSMRPSGPASCPGRFHETIGSGASSRPARCRCCFC